MKRFTFKKEFELDERDIIDLIDCAVEGGIGYWYCLHNDTPEWNKVREEYPDDCIDERLYRVLDKGYDVILSDVEEDTEYKLTMASLLDGIQKAIELGYWDGDMDMADAETGDTIFQCALFGDLIYG